MQISDVVTLTERQSLSPLQRRVFDYLESHRDEVFSYRDESLAQATKAKLSAIGFTLWTLHQRGLIGKEKVGRKVYFGSHSAIAELKQRVSRQVTSDWFERAGRNREAILRKHGYINVLELLDEVRQGR